MFITAKFNSTCPATGLPIKKGDRIYYDRTFRKAYHVNSQRAIDATEADNTRSYIQAQEDAYFDNVWNSIK